jgi:hypothetical protein
MALASLSVSYVVAGVPQAGAASLGSTLQAGGILNEGDLLTSQNGVFTAVLQYDGNFVVYDLDDPLWANHLSNAEGPNRLVLQDDGNLVAYLSNNRPLWASGSFGGSGSFLVMQNDGNLVLYNASSQPVWSTRTSEQPPDPSAPSSPRPPLPNVPPQVLAQEESSSYTVSRDAGFSVSLPNGYDFWLFGDTAEASTNQRPIGSPSSLGAGQQLQEGGSLQSPNGLFTAVLQYDGNFVLYGPQGPLWADHVNSYYGPNHLVLQYDGNLVAYLWNDRPLWASGTFGGSGSVLVMQDDGNLVVYDGRSQPLWASGTSQPLAAPSWYLTGFIPGATAAEQLTPANAVPTSLTELSGNPAQPSPFLPTPDDVYLPDGSGRICSSANGALYAARWPSGVTALPGGSRLLISYGDVCVSSSGWTVEGWGFMEYDWSSNLITQQPTDVFAPVRSGAADPIHAQIQSPVIDASGNVDFFYVPDCPGRSRSCASPGTIKVISIPNNLAALSNPASYDLNQAPPVVTTLAAPGGTNGWYPLLAAVSSATTQGGAYVMVEQTDILGGYTVLSAPAPTGPWTSISSGSMPSCSTLSWGFCYAMNAHPELSSSRLFISYLDPAAGPDSSMGHLVMTSIPLGG